MRELEINYEVNLFTGYGLGVCDPPVTLRLTVIPECLRYDWDQSPYSTYFTARSVIDVDAFDQQIGGYIEDRQDEFGGRFRSGRSVRVQLKAVPNPAE